MVFIENSTTIIIIIESWFIPFDIIMIVCAILAIIFAIIFLSVVIRDKKCHTVPVMLIANSCLAGLVLACDMCAMAIFALYNDLQQIQNQDLFCVFRSYMIYAGCALQNYSYLVSSIYRYITVIYPARLAWQKARAQLIFVGATWAFSLGFAFPYLFTGDITYNYDNQICQVPLGLSFPVIFGTLCAYMIPVTMIMSIYFKLVLYVKGMNKRITPANTLLRAQRDLKMVRRIVILIMVILTIGCPYIVMIVLSFFNRTPRYHFRIIYMSTNISMIFIMVALFQITDPIRTCIMKSINRRRRPNVIVAVIS